MINFVTQCAINPVDLIMRKLFINLFILGCLSTSPAYGQESSGLWAALGEYVSRLAGNLDYIEIGSDDLGIDDGLIAQVIFGIGRTVEINPNSSGDHDFYLVKDTMRVGLRLGAGFIVAGSGSYVRKYTLVYPVDKKLKGIFHDKFIVNFLLPYQVAFDKLPKQYVLMTESFIEGQGRIKIGGTPLIPLGSTTSLGRVQLNRTFIDHKSENKLKVFKDKAKYTQLAQDISFSLGLLGIPIYNGTLDKGRLERQYLQVKLSDQQVKRSAYKGLRKLIADDDVSELYPLGSIHKVKTKFLQSYNYFTLAWLFTIEGMDRTDRIQEYHQDRDEYVTRYQVENRKYVSWTLGIDGEAHISRLWAMARGIGENGYVEPEVRISLLAKDGWLKDGEMNGAYNQFVDKLTYNKDFMPIDNEFTKGKHLTGEFHMKIDLHLYEEAFEILLNTSEKKYWMALAKVTGKPYSYFKDAKERNYHGRIQRRMRQDRIPIRDMYLAKSMNGFLRWLKYAKKEEDPLAKMHYLVLALRKLTYVTPETFSPEIYQIIHGLVGTKNLFIKAEYMNMVTDIHLHNGGEHRRVSRTMGNKRESKNRFHPFYFQDASEIYYLF